MKDPVNFYRYTLTDFIGPAVVSPLGESSFIVEWNLIDEEKLDFPKELPGKFLFKGEAFDRLYLIEKTANRCGYIYLTVERKCAEDWVVWFNGRFILNDAEWDLHRGEVVVKLDKWHDDDCLEEGKNREINLMDFIPLADRKIAKLYEGTVVIEKVTYTHGPFNYSAPLDTDLVWGGVGPPSAGAWVSYYHYYALFYLIPLVKEVRETKWARQTMNLPTGSGSPGAEWVIVSTAAGVNKWAKPVSLYECTETQIMKEGDVIVGHRKECKILGDEQEGINQLDNGMALADILDVFLSELCPGSTVKSQFFQINPDTITGTNYVTGAASKVLNLILFQKSDVKRPNVANNATKAVVSFEKFMAGLVVMFNVRWRKTGTIFRIEHVSWFPKNNGLDLTTPYYQKYVKGLNRYDYKSEQIPNKEEFKFMEAGGVDFVGLPIYYEGGCVPETGRKNAKTVTAESITTDVELCLQNPDPRDSIVEDRGFVWVAAGPTGLILSEPGILGTTRINNTLAWAQLHRDYHKHYRALKTGIMNGAPTEFLSVRPLKKGVTLTIPAPCSLPFTPDDVIKTALGDGTVEKAVFRFKDSMIAIDLLYPSDEDLYLPPVAVNDVYHVNQGVSSTLNVTANDLPSPTSPDPISVVEIVTPPSHGTVTLWGLAIVFNPTPGYYGPDNIVYRVKDLAGIPSNNALIALTIGSGLYAALIKTNDQTFDVSNPFCVPVIVTGTKSTAYFYVQFSSDPGGTNLVDVSGMGIDINIRISAVIGSPSATPVESTFSVPATGATTDIFGTIDREYFTDLKDCDGVTPVSYNQETYSLDPGPYTII